MRRSLKRTMSWATRCASLSGSWRTRSASVISGKASYQDMVAELSKALAQLQQQLTDLTSQRNSGDV
jgi:hypothetical protein